MHNPRGKLLLFTAFSHATVQFPASASPPACLLTDLGVIAVRGLDARKFLNGQLSQDVLGLSADRVELAGLHNPQGRVLAVLRLVPLGSSDVLCVLPRALIDDTLATLRKFLLRARATISDESAAWQIEGLGGDESLPDVVGAARRDGDCVLWRHATDGRVLRLCAADASTMAKTSATPADPGSVETWRLADIAAGLPQVTPATRGEFVAQMLNLDVLGGISFNKGCYTGQEVIARAHYRGRVKRRAQRFRAAVTDLALGEGATVQLQTGPSTSATAQVLQQAQGRQGVEFLAVSGFAPETASQTAPASHLSATNLPTIAAINLPMSYPLPD